MNARMTYSIISSVSDGIDSTTRGETGDDLDEFWVLIISSVSFIPSCVRF